MRNESQKEPSESRFSWRARFSVAFVCTGFAMFAWCYFAPPAMSLGAASLAAATVGLFFGTLAAVFGQRMFDFIMGIPW